MELVFGTRLFGHEGDEVGWITHFLVNMRVGCVTHLVARRGAIYSEATLLGFDQLQAADSEQVVVNLRARDLKRLPRFGAKNLLPVQWSRDSHYEPGSTAMRVRHDEWSRANRRAAEEQYIQGISADRSHTLVLRAAAVVYDGKQNVVGSLKGVGVDMRSGMLLELLITQPGPMKSRIRVPALGCNFASAGEVHLTGNLSERGFARRTADARSRRNTEVIEMEAGG